MSPCLVRTTRRPRRRFKSFWMRIASFRLTSFSKRPVGPDAPVSLPPWPASMTTTSKTLSPNLRGFSFSETPFGASSPLVSETMSFVRCFISESLIGAVSLSVFSPIRRSNIKTFSPRISSESGELSMRSKASVTKSSGTKIALLTMKGEALSLTISSSTATRLLPTNMTTNLSPLRRTTFRPRAFQTFSTPREFARTAKSKNSWPLTCTS